MKHTRLRAFAVFASFAALALFASFPAQAITALVHQGQSGVGTAGSGKVYAPVLLTDAATGQTGQTGLASTATVTVYPPGGTGFVAATGMLSELGFGYYAYWPSAAETGNTGITLVRVTAPNTMESGSAFQVVGSDPAQDIPTPLASLTARPAQTGDTFGLISPLIASSKFTASALSLAPTGSGGAVTDASIQADMTSILAGGVTLKSGEYANIAAGLLASAFITIPGDHTTSGLPLTLTYKQMHAVLLAVPGSDNASTAPAPSTTATTSYYLAGQPQTSANLVYVGTVTYNAAGQQSGRTVKIAAPFPTF